MLNNTYGGDKITFHYRYRKQIIIASVLLLIIGITIYFFLTIKPTKTSKKETEPIFNIKEEKKLIFKLPIEGSLRTLIKYLKIKETNKKYPRRYNEIIKKDL